MRSSRPRNVLVGKQILDIITTGMYNEPLMAIREYVQNAVDAIDAATQKKISRHEGGQIEIGLDGASRRMVIEDNGVGVANREVPRVLCSIGCSTKRQDMSRGFRGIGRFGGAGYCDRLVFATRQSSKERVAHVTLDCNVLRKLLSNGQVRASVENAVRNSMSIEYRPASRADRPHFFRVELQGVRRFHRDELMNVEAISRYLSEVAPVPFDESRFPIAKKIEAHLASLSGFRSYRISVNGARVFRPHSRTVTVNGKSLDHIDDVELFNVHGRDGEPIGRGWYAQMQYVASIPPTVRMCGIRVRQGNVEIGDEHSLAGHFAERRFATWHVGEIHLDYSVKANARRDGFEQCPHYEAFLERANGLGQHLSRLCRASSKARSRRVGAERMLAQAERLAGLSVAIDRDDLNLRISRATQALEEIEERSRRDGWYEEIKGRVATTRGHLSALGSDPPLLYGMIDGRKLRHIDCKTLLEDVGKAIVADHNSAEDKQELLLRVVQPYLNAKYLSRLSLPETPSPPKRRG